MHQQVRMGSFVKKYKTHIKVVLIILVLGFIGQFLRNTDFAEIKNYLLKLPYTFFGILGLSFLAYVSATFAWKLCLGSDEGKVDLIQLFMIRHVGEVLSVFNPTSVVAGEALKVHYLRSNQVAKENGISSILMSRILIILSAILLLALSLWGWEKSGFYCSFWIGRYGIRVSFS